MKRLFLFTNFYPYSYIENFLEDEINYLARGFEEVFLVPCFFENTVRHYPDNCKLVPSTDPYPYKRKISFNRKTFFPFLKELFSFQVVKDRKKIRRLISVFFQANYMLNSKRIKSILSNLTSNDVLYFYWGVGPNIIAAFNSSNAKMVSRFHGQWDLWEDEYDGYLPFRRTIISRLNAVVAISTKGRDYLRMKYPYAKAYLYPLGSNDYGLCIDNTQTTSIRILSCSEVYLLKRVDLIFRSLLEIKDQSIIWTHIGDGVDMEKIKKMSNTIAHPNLEITFLGRLPHNEVMDYLKEHRFDVFVNLSTLEGVPVSIMEAISFDIPVVATDVGGTSDVVPPECGVLVSANPSEKEVADSIRKVINGRYSPRRFWEEHYSADRNYGNFAQFLYEL